MCLGFAGVPSATELDVIEKASAHRGAAREAGCDVAVITTQPSSTSQQNAQRRGFDLLYTRATLVTHP